MNTSIKTALLYKLLDLPRQQIPPKIAVTAYNDVLVAGEGTAVQVESTQGYAERIGTTLGRTLFQVGLAPFITALVLFVGLLRVRLGAPENLPMPRRPNHADELLGALDPFLECFAELSAKAPSDMEGVDLEQLREDRGRLLEVRELLKVLQPLMEGLQAVEAHLENRLDTPVRAVVTQLRGLIERNQSLRVGLSRSLQYVFQDAQEAQVTQREHKRIIEKTEQATETRVRAEVAAQDKAKDAPREPQSPPPRK